MKRMKCALAALLCALLLSGCGVNQLNAAGYVQGLLDETYKGTWEVTYLKLVDLSSSELQANYRAGLEAEYERFSDYFLLNPYGVADETEAAFVDWLGQVYAKARYTVDHATRSDSGAWLVEVTVRPILTVADLADLVDDWRSEFLGSTELTGPEREEAWAQLVLAECQAASIEYGDAVTIAVRLAADEEGYYSIGTQDFYNLDALILSYGY